MLVGSLLKHMYLRILYLVLSGETIQMTSACNKNCNNADPKKHIPRQVHLLMCKAGSDHEKPDEFMIAH